MPAEPIAIMRRDHLYLNHWHCSEEQALRFAGVFRQTWQQLPLWARRPMLKDWQDCKAAWIARDITEETFLQLAALPMPTISIESWIGRSQQVALGAYFGEGERRLQFWQPAVEMMPDEVVSTLVAHELGHGFLHALGQAPSKMLGYVAPAKGEEWWDDEEVMVREAMCDWGFEDADISLWLDKHKPHMMAVYEARMQQFEQAA